MRVRVMKKIFYVIGLIVVLVNYAAATNTVPPSWKEDFVKTDAYKSFDPDGSIRQSIIEFMSNRNGNSDINSSGFENLTIIEEHNNIVQFLKSQGNNFPSEDQENRMFLSRAYYWELDLNEQRPLNLSDENLYDENANARMADTRLLAMQRNAKHVNAYSYFHAINRLLKSLRTNSAYSDNYKYRIANMIVVSIKNSFAGSAQFFDEAPVHKQDFDLPSYLGGYTPEMAGIIGETHPFHTKLSSAVQFYLSTPGITNGYKGALHDALVNLSYRFFMHQPDADFPVSPERASMIFSPWILMVGSHKSPISSLDTTYYMALLSRAGKLMPFINGRKAFEGEKRLVQPMTMLDGMASTSLSSAEITITKMLHAIDQEKINIAWAAAQKMMSTAKPSVEDISFLTNNLSGSIEISRKNFAELKKQKQEEQLQALQASYRKTFTADLTKATTSFNDFLENNPSLRPYLSGIGLFGGKQSLLKPKLIDSNILAADVEGRLTMIINNLNIRFTFLNPYTSVTKPLTPNAMKKMKTLADSIAGELAGFSRHFEKLKTIVDQGQSAASQMESPIKYETQKKNKKKRNRKKNKKGGAVAGVSQAADTVKVLEAAEEVTPVVSQTVMDMPMPVEYKDVEPKVVEVVTVEPLESASASPALPSQSDPIESHGSKGSSSGEEVLKAVPGTDEPTTMRVRRDRDSKRLSTILTPAELKAEKRKSRVSLSINPEALKEKLALEERKLQRSQSTMNFKTAKADQMKERRLSRKLSVADLLREKKEKRASTRLTPGDIKEEPKDMGPNGRIKTFHGDAETVFQGAKADETDMAAHQLMMRLSTAKTLKKFKKELDPGNNFEKIKNPMSCLEGFIQNHKKPKVYSIRINSSSANRICIIMDKNKNYHIWYGDYH